MTTSRFGQSPLSLRKPSRKRRPTGISRRRKKQLGFETLEDRRVMSADSSLVFVPISLSQEDFTSYSSATPEGAQQILLQEIERYLSQANASAQNAVVNSIPSDPLVPDQWHLVNFGQQVGNPDFQSIFATPGEDINVAPVWNMGYTGEGVVVAVIDSGVEFTHPDLAGNIDPNFQYDALEDDGDASPLADNLNPFTPLFLNAHGTSVAGIIGAIADNGLGGSGIAYNSQLVPIRLIDPFNPVSNPDDPFVDAFRFATDQIDITNNSWGPAVVRGLAGPTAAELLAIRDSIFFGRPDANGDPLGVIHVFSAGNSGEQLDSSGYSGWINSRYTIGVTSVDHDGEYDNIDGTVTGLAETGASVLVAAPDGSAATLNIVDDTGVGSGIVTTDTTGNTGFNVSDNTGFPQGDRDFLADTDYTSRFGDTSASAPMVSAVIALMLEANPNLTWRDVQEILVRSSRQNSEFATQANGIDKAVGIEYQNTWIINQLPLFHDPDAWDPLIPAATQILNPTLDPTRTFTDFGFNDNHYAPTPQVLANGAGYTVSQGRGTNAEQTGFAHGVVDAELAVLLAEQWHTKNQALPDELTFTTAVNGSPNLPAAEVVNNVLGTADLIVPGGLGGTSGFGAYWAEYLSGNPNFNQGFFARGVPIELTVPDSNNMTVDHIDFSFTITGGPISDFLDNVRVVLVSPNGTQSELNHYFIDPSYDLDDFHQASPALNPTLSVNGLDGVTGNNVDYLDAGSVDTGVTTFTFSTNRNWGERSDDAIVIDPSTGEPVIDPFAVGGNRFNLINSDVGDLMSQGWQLYMENYSPTSFVLQNFEVAWHGSPIGANTQRIQGLIGVDDNEDDAFNYSRVIQAIAPAGTIDLDTTTNRLGEVVNLIDPNHESMGANITVSLRRASDNVLVDQFVTGADGNYYFDVVPGNYIVSIEDPLGRTALDDSLTPNGFLKDYQSEWLVTTDFFNAWDYDANLEVPINAATGAPVAFLDGTNSPVQTNVKNINFLLDPGEPEAQQVDVSGVVYADINGDGVFNSDDVALPNARVYGDVNRNGEFDAGEVFTTTDAAGQYILTVAPIVASTVINVGVIPPSSWTASNPASGFRTFFVQPGDEISGVDFYVTPPAAATAGDGTLNSSVITGFVFNDANGDTVRQATEAGVPNITVYIDSNNSGSIDAGDIVTQTNSNGAYAFAGLSNGSKTIRLNLDPSSLLTQTFPTGLLPQIVTVTSGGTVPNVRFGIRNPTVGGALDFGDLPDVYGTTLASNGARHTKGNYYLGSSVDTEFTGFPSADALGDDSSFVDDEDGVTVDPLVEGGVGRLEVIASQFGAYLQGWVDFNGDGDFSDIIDGVSEQILVNALLVPGLNVLNFDIPDTIDASTVYARFRYGEFGLGPVGAAAIGEVEDYVLAKAAAPVVPLVIAHGPDFNSDGEVSGDDFLAWQRGFGKTSNATAQNGDSDGDADVDSDDLADWEAEYGASASGSLAGAQTSESGPSAQQSGSEQLSVAPALAPQLSTEIQTSDSEIDNGTDYSPAVVAAGAQQSNASSPVTVASSTSEAPTASERTAAQPIASTALGDAVPTSVGRSSSISLASVVSEASRRFQHGTRFDRDDHEFIRRARIETQTTETSFNDSIDLVELGYVMHDQALDRMFGRRERLFEQLPWNSERQDDESADALEAVLGEEVEWRFV